MVKALPFAAPNVEQATDIGIRIAAPAKTRVPHNCGQNNQIITNIYQTDLRNLDEDWEHFKQYLKFYDSISVWK